MVCSRWPSAIIVLLLSVPFSSADEPAATETVVQFTISPQAAPRPALRYLLLPDLKERHPGNAVPAFYKCMFEQNHFYYNQEQEKLRQKWQTVPLAEVPGDELKNYGGAGLMQADYAARLDTVDWQLTGRIKTDGVSLLLPDVQVLRHVASALKVRFRGEVKRGDSAAALVTAKTMFALARMFGEHPTLIGNLVGIAVSQLAIAPLEELMSQPGCPSLFWALTQLPVPFINIQSGFEGERLFVVSEFGSLLEDLTPLSDAQLQKYVSVFRKLTTLIEPGQAPKISGDDWVQKRAADPKIVKAASTRLQSFGISPAQLQKMPALQIIMLDEVRRYEDLRDDGLKWATMPFWRIPKVYMEDKAGSNPLRLDVAEDSLMAPWTPAILKVRRTQLRLEQRLALLQHVEALRLYAAAHNGSLPASLSDIELPLPVDPFSGRPFVFATNGVTATIRGTAPPGTEKLAPFNVKYEITIRK